MPFMYFPTFYCVKELVQGPPGGNVVVDGLSKYKENWVVDQTAMVKVCLLYTSPSPRDRQKSRMPSSA